MSNVVPELSRIYQVELSQIIWKHVTCAVQDSEFRVKSDKRRAKVFWQTKQSSVIDLIVWPKKAAKHILSDLAAD